MPESIRLNKHLAHTLGVSRREADQHIEQGRVTINGAVATLGNIVQPGRDKVALDGSPITTAVKHYTYLLMNKPTGYVCSRKQQGDTPTIYALLPEKYRTLKVAGRLDKDSCGLLLLTDDGDTIFKLTHPRFGKAKVYHVQLSKPLTHEDLDAINSGIVLDDGKSNMSVKPLNDPSSPHSYTVTMKEGRNRQIRRTFGGQGYMVTRLERIQFGPYKLSELNGSQCLLK